MHADSHFVIGKSHVNGGKPCQDYAAAGQLPEGGAYAIVSDGCSSGGRTDVGARVLTLATARTITQPWHLMNAGSSRLMVGSIRLQQQTTLAATIELLGCDPSDMLATSVLAVATPNDRFVYLQGDGVIAWRETSGRIILTEFEWADNLPAYPAYARDTYAAFIARHGGDLAAPRLTSTMWCVENSELKQLREDHLNLAQGIEGIFWPLIEGDDLDLIAVFTDGVTQVEGMTWQEAVVELLAFKSLTGDFVKRRLNSFVRTAAKLGRGPLDDLAYAVINLTCQPTSEVG